MTADFMAMLGHVMGPGTLYSRLCSGVFRAGDRHGLTRVTGDWKSIVGVWWWDRGYMGFWGYRGHRGLLGSRLGTRHLAVTLWEA